ncbi:redox-sensitive transcriptional activator SoxR [Nocardioides immobilis]|uniref:Redox-sensitive transcriptional activator SoxR n=1 Tax=Nocardioides immobilis TaxID=2049295 RepID=A0A417Y3L9_9ACTN|nr:redox-sensitive transcriptional activator SoxR [Nocardioides immobilis]RHW27249.1 redox-sensitive transcriptional activator SoxR [Nocardioides immobilis]
MTLLTIGQLAERAGVATSAIRFYEDKGLVRSTRTTGNQRRYEQSTLRRVAFVRAAQRVGLSLEEVAEALGTLPDHRAPTKSDWHRISREWKPRLEEQIRRIRLLEQRLDSCIGCGCLSLKSCSLMNPGDVAGEQGGKGAVLLEP